MNTQGSDPSVGDLLGSLARDTGTLVRQEVRLASSEMTTKATKALHDIELIGMGGGLAHAGLLAIIAGAAVGLGTIIPIWISLLVVGVVAVAVGFGFAQAGRHALLRIDPIPQQTAQTLEEDKAWAKEQLHGQR